MGALIMSKLHLMGGQKRWACVWMAVTVFGTFWWCIAEFLK